MKMPLRADIPIQSKPFGKMGEGIPKAISKGPWKPRTLFFLGKPPVGFLVMVISQESITGSPQDLQVWANMPAQNPFLPQAIKTFHGRVSPGLSLGDENQMDSQKQVKTNPLGKTGVVGDLVEIFHF